MPLMPTSIVGPGAAVSGLTLLYDQTLTADAASFDVQNIPQGYKHLLVRGSFRSTRAAQTSDFCRLRFNNDSGNNYYNELMFATSSTEDAVEELAAAGSYFEAPAASAPSGSFGFYEMQVNDYANSTLKMLRAQAGYAKALTSGNIAIFDITTLWDSTAAINRITVLPLNGNWLAGSRLTIYGLAGAPAQNLITPDGWISDTDAWTYVSATTFTTPNDVTVQFSKGTRIKLYNQSLKYFVVVGSSYAGGLTTVTITGGSDYSLASAAITDTYYSYQANPQGYPGWFNFSPAYTGFSADPSGSICRFSIIGNICTFKHSRNDGTSNATGFTIGLPVNSQNNQGGFSGMSGDARIKNSGTISLTPGMLGLNDDASSISVYRDWGGQNWTNSGAKNAAFTVVYEL